MKNLVICHGDADGLIAAAVILKTLSEPAEVVITQPFLLSKIKTEEADNIYIVDIAINNKKPEETIAFAELNRNKIQLWCDHHDGTEILSILKDKLIYDSEAPSCPALLQQNNFIVPQNWVDAANASDRPTSFEKTYLSERYNKSFKVALTELEIDKQIVNKIQRAWLDELLTGKECQLITEYSNRYEPLMIATEQAAETTVELLPGVGIIQLNKQKVDITALFTKAYQRGMGVIVIQKETDEGAPISIIGTNKQDLNLVEIFGLKSGAPFRVSLLGEHQQIRLLLQQKLS